MDSTPQIPKSYKWTFTSRTVPGSIPIGVTGFFSVIFLPTEP